MGEKLSVPASQTLNGNQQSPTFINGNGKPFSPLEELEIIGKSVAKINPDGTLTMLDVAKLELVKRQQPEIRWYELRDQSGRRYFSHPDYFCTFFKSYYP